MHVRVKCLYCAVRSTCEMFYAFVCILSVSYLTEYIYLVLIVILVAVNHRPPVGKLSGVVLKECRR